MGTTACVMRFSHHLSLLFTMSSPRHGHGIAVPLPRNFHVIAMSRAWLGNVLAMYLPCLGYDIDTALLCHRHDMARYWLGCLLVKSTLCQGDQIGRSFTIWATFERVLSDLLFGQNF